MQDAGGRRCATRQSAMRTYIPRCRVGSKPRWAGRPRAPGIRNTACRGSGSASRRAAFYTTGMLRAFLNTKACVQEGVAPCPARPGGAGFLLHRHASGISQHESVCSDKEWPLAQLVREELAFYSTDMLRAFLNTKAYVPIRSGPLPSSSGRSGEACTLPSRTSMRRSSPLSLRRKAKNGPLPCADEAGSQLRAVKKRGAHVLPMRDDAWYGP